MVKEKNKIENSMLGGILIIILITFIGLGFLRIIGASITPLRNPYSIVNESLNIAVARLDGNSINESYGFSLNNDNWVDNSVDIYNSTRGALIENTDYIVNYTEEKIYFKNSTTMVNYISNITLVDYSYYDDRYLSNATDRALLGIITLFVIVGILAGVMKPIVKSWLLKKLK